jgi:hypothetical protein
LNIRPSAKVNMANHRTDAFGPKIITDADVRDVRLIEDIERRHICQQYCGSG